MLRAVDLGQQLVRQVAQQIGVLLAADRSPALAGEASLPGQVRGLAGARHQRRGPQPMAVLAAP